MRQPRIDDSELSLAELMARWPQTIPVFVRHRMLCAGCQVGPFHTVADACEEYKLEQDAFLAELKLAAGEV